MIVNTNQIKQIQEAYVSSIEPLELVKELEKHKVKFVDWCKLGNELDLVYAHQAFEEANLKYHCRIITGILLKK